MKYTAIAAILFGVVAAVYAGFHYISGAPSGEAESPSTASLVIPLAFAACLVIVGMLLWAFAGKGYTQSRTNSLRQPVRRPAVFPSRDAKNT